MLDVIKTLLLSIDSKSAYEPLDADTWPQIIYYFCKGDKNDQTYLLAELTKRPQLDKKIDSFKQRAFKVLPNLKILELSREQWLKAIICFEKQRGERFTRSTLIMIFSELMGIDEPSLNSILAIESLSRNAKRSSISPDENFPPSKKRKAATGENPLIYVHPSKNADTLPPGLTDTGVRIVRKICPASPEPGHPNLCRIVGEEEKLRPLFEHACGQDKTILYKPITPIGKKPLGRIEIKANPEKIYPEFERPTTAHFTITKSTMQCGRSTKRRKNPVSCFWIFRANTEENMRDGRKQHWTPEENIKESREHHWTHLVARFLGGGHQVTPATAAANYNILDTVELFIAQKIREGVDSIEMDVECTYNKNNKRCIADLITYNLSWRSPQDNEKVFTEVIRINPGSYQRITGRMKKSFEVIRSNSQEIQTSHEAIEPRF